MLVKWRENINSYFFKKELGVLKRKVKGTNFSLLKSASFVFVFETQEEYNAVKKIVKFIKEEGIKKVVAIGFCNQKQMPEFIQYSPDFVLFAKSDLNWYFKPVCDDVNSFLKEEWDVLIDLTEVNNPTINNVIGLSKSKLKVGRSGTAKDSLFDLTLAIDAKHNTLYYLEQVYRYLKELNKT